MGKQGPGTPQDGAATETAPATHDPDSGGVDPERIPGIQTGVVVDPRALAAVHESELHSRSGAIREIEIGVSHESGAITRSSVTHTAVSEDRLLARFQGDHVMLSSDATTREIYFDGDELYHRSLFDNEWHGQQISADLSTLRRGEFDGTYRLEMMLGGTHVVGEHPDAAGQFVLQNPDSPGGEVRNSAVASYRNRAVVDGDGLCHEWRTSYEDHQRDPVELFTREARVDAIEETSVPRPDWVEDM